MPTPSRFPVVYDEATEATSGPSPGAQALMRHTIEHFAARSLGIYHVRNVVGGSSLSKHARGEAGDSGYPYTIGGTPEGWRLANWLLLWHAELGVQTVIYARKVWSNVRDAEGWRHYGGHSAHWEHVHWELTGQAAAELTSHMILTRTSTNTEDDTMALLIPHAAIEALLITRVEQAYQLVAHREADIGGLRYWVGLVLADYRDGRDPEKHITALELAALNELSPDQRETVARMIADSNA